MIKKLSTIVILTGLFSISQASTLSENNSSETEYQYNTISSLMSGNYGSVVTVAEAKRKVNFGLGAVQDLGELIVLNGKYYEADPNGDITDLDDNAGLSYVTGTFLMPDRDQSFQLKDMTLSEMEQKINEYNRSHGNARYYAAMIAGTFSSVKFRSEDKDHSKPGIPLSQWLKYHQNEFSLDNVEGDMVLFELPADIQGVGVPGDHVHFINQARTRGGHVLDAEIKNVSVIFQPLKTLKVYPGANKADLQDLHDIESQSIR